jgi:hypothetical protein
MSTRLVIWVSTIHARTNSMAPTNIPSLRKKYSQEEEQEQGTSAHPSERSVWSRLVKPCLILLSMKPSSVFMWNVMYIQLMQSPLFKKITYPLESRGMRRKGRERGLFGLDRIHGSSSGKIRAKVAMILCKKSE